MTLIFLAVSCFAVIATLAIGLDGNTPALGLALVAAAALVLAFVHPWRRAREFRYLCYASGLGFGVFVVLHNLLEAGAVAAEGVGPPAMIIGLGGALIMTFRGGHDNPSQPAA